MGKRRRRSSKKGDDEPASDDEEERERKINEELRASLIQEVDDEDDLSEDDFDENGEEEGLNDENEMEDDEEDEEEQEDNEDDEEEDSGDTDFDKSARSRTKPEHVRHYHEPVAAPPSKFDVPTADEQRALRSADELIRSNLLVLQTEELLSEARAQNSGKSKSLEVSTGSDSHIPDKNIKKREKESVALRAWLFELRNFLLSMEACTVTAEEHLAQCPGLPLSAHGRAAMASEQVNALKGTSKKTGHAAAASGAGHEPAPLLNFTPPTKVDVVGPFMVQTLTKMSNEPCCVDVVLTMSPEILGPRDHVNCRYLDKRHLYLGAVAKALQKAEIKETALNGNKAAAVADSKKKDKKSKKAKTEEITISSSPLLRVGSESLSVQVLDGDTRHCCLLLRPNGAAGKTFTVRLSAQLDPSSIPAKRLVPDHGNLRRYWSAPTEASNSGEDILRVATPCYNAMVLSDLGEAQLYTRLLHAALGEEDGCPAMREAMILARVWLNSRKASGSIGIDTFTDKQLDYLMLYLLRGKKAIGAKMLPLQVFTLFLNFLASGSLTKNPLALPPQSAYDDDDNEVNEWGYSNDKVSNDELALFSRCYEVVLVEPSMRLNVLASVSTAGARELQREASSSVAMLRISDGSGEDALEAFHSVFFKRIPFSSRYDCYVTLPFREPSASLPVACFHTNKSTVKTSTENELEETERKSVLDLPASLQLIRKLPVLLKEAFTDRVTQVEARVFFGSGENILAKNASHKSFAVDKQVNRSAIRCHSWMQWGLTDISPGGSEGIGSGGGKGGRFGTVVVGINCEPTKANRIVDRGPPADDARKAVAFRNFWGEKSELRRFKDGSIVEAVLWQSDNESTCGVIEQITTYILQRHAPSYSVAKISESKLPNYSVPSHMKISFVGSQLENFLLTSDYMSGIRSAIEVFDELDTRLKVISGSTKALVKGKQHSFTRKAGSSNLPLKIDAVHCLSPHLRYASLFPPSNITNGGKSRLQEPLEVLVRFERSNGWPDNLKALQAAKTAFLIQICRSLEEFNQQPSNESKKGKRPIRKEIICYPNHGFADVWLKGYVFRLRILVEKEASLIAWPTEVASKAIGGNKNKKNSFPVLSQDPLTSSGNGSLSPQEVQRRATMVKFGHKKVLSSHVESIAQLWGAYAPIPERWRVRVTNLSLPSHHSLIHGLAVAQRAFSPSLRLVLRWMAAHRLTHQLPVPLVELLVAHAFFHGRGACIAQTSLASSAADAPATKKLSSGLGVGVEGIPSSALHGLHRFLLLLTTHDWEETPLIVQPDPYENSTKIISRNKAEEEEEEEDEEGAGGRGGRKSLGLSGEDRRMILKVYDQLKALQPVSKENQQQVGHATVSSMWVVAPYDRQHGWLSSWGVMHEKAASVENACFPGVGQNGQLSSSETAASSSSSASAQASGFDGDNGFNGVEKAVLHRIKASALESLQYLDEWIRFNANPLKSTRKQSDGVDASNVWKRAFIAQEPRLSLGASVKLQLNSKLSLDSSSLASKSEVLSGQDLFSIVEKGPAGLRMKTQYSNLRASEELVKGDGSEASESVISQQLVGLRPLETSLAQLRARYGHLALFFPEALPVMSGISKQSIYVVWRPSVFMPSAFRVMESQHRIRVDTDHYNTRNAKKSKKAPANDDDDEEEDPFAAPKQKSHSAAMVGVPDIVGLSKDMVECSEGVVEKCVFL